MLKPNRGWPSAGASVAHNDFWCGMSREHAGGDAKLLIKFAWPKYIYSSFRRREFFVSL